MGRQDAVCELAYSGAWQTAPAYVRDRIVIARGRGNETSEPTPQTLAGTLDNRTGAYNPRNAASPLFGLVGRNTPQREGLDLAVESFGGTSSSGWTPTDGGLPWTGVGALAADFTESGGIGRHLQPLKGIVRVSLLADQRRDVEQVTEVSIPAVAVGASAVVGHVSRRQAGGDYYWTRLEFDVGGAITAKISRTVSGSFTELAVRSGIPGLTYTAGQSYTLRTSVSGSRVSMRVWPTGTAEPSTWTLTAVDSSATLTGPGRYGLASWAVTGNTNTTEIRFDNYRAVDRRFVGEVASWKPGRSVEFNPVTGKGDAWTEVEAAGILRRLGQGNDPLASPLRRAILAAAPSAYWPLEDADGALSAASAVAGVDDMQPFGFSRFTAPGTGAPVAAAGLPKFGSGNGIPGSAPVLDLAQGGVLTGSVPPSAGNGWRVEFVLVAPRDKAAARIPIRWTTNGSWDTWEFQIESTGLFATYGNGLSGVGSASASFNVFDGQPHHYQIEAFQSGGNLDARIYVDDVFVDQYTVTAGSPGSIASVIVNPLEEVNGTESMPVLGHVAVWNPSVGLSTSAVAMLGHAGETAGTRFLRLCDEEGVAATVLGDVDDMQPMGPQRTGVDLVELLAEIERTEGGILYEPRDGLGLVLRSVRDLYNQAPTLTLDWSAYQVAPPFAPAVDDQGTRNDVTAKSTTSGAEARAVLEAGAMSVQPPPAGVGRYGTKLDVNPASDATLADLAAWALHKGTVDELRVPRVTVDLVGNPGLLAAATAVDVGDRILLTGLPADMGDDEVSLLVLGYTEVIGSHTRTITFNCVPASPYDVATVDGEPRVAADGSTLAADLAATAIPTLNSNPYFEVNASGWLVNSGGSIARSTAQAHEGVASLQFTPDGVTATCEVRSANAPGVVAGQTYRASAWVRCAAARSVNINIVWRDAAGTFLSSAGAVSISVAADTWAPIEVVGVAPASAAQGQISVSMGSTPPASHLLYIDEAALRPTLTLLLASTAENGPWTSDVSDMPLDVRVGGERVTASAIGRYVDDGMDRTVSGSWGTEPTTGLVWAVAGGLPAQYGVASGGGWHDVEVLNQTRRTRLPVSLLDVEVLMMCASNALAVGGNQECSPMMRIDPNDIGGTYYYAEVEFSTTQTVRARLMRRQASVDTALTTAFDIPGLVHAAGRVFWTRAQVIGDWVRMRVWQDGTPEPSVWTVEAQDTAPLLTPGQVGVRSTLDPTSTNPLPVRLTTWHFAITSPQTVTLSARGVNGVSRAWSAGTEVDVWFPAIVAL